MANWGDEDEYFKRASRKLELERTEGMRIEPGPLRPSADTPRCAHCHDPYDAVDEDDEARYRGLCLACAESYRDQDRQDDLVIDHEETPPHRLG
jgi:hypothetical protein